MLKNIFIVQFGSNFFRQLINTVGALFVARFAGPEVVGIIGYSYAFVSIFLSIPGIFGSPFITIYSKTNGHPDTTATFKVLQFISIFVFAVVVIVSLTVKISFFSSSIDTQEQIIVTILILAVLTFQSLFTFIQSVYTAKLKQAKANILLVVRSFLFNIVRVLIAYLGFTAIYLSSWNLISFILLMPYFVYLLNKIPFGSFKKRIAKQFYNYSYAIFMITAVDYLLRFSDKIFLGSISNAEEVGYYTIAFSLGGMIILLGNSIGSVFFPYFSVLLKDRKEEVILSKIKTFQKFNFQILIPIVLFVSIISYDIIPLLLGNKYVNSILPFIFILNASVLLIIGMPFGNIISAAGKFYLLAFSNFIKLIFYILGMIFLAHPFFLNMGAIGLSINVLLANLVQLLLMLILSNRIIRIARVNNKYLYSFSIYFIVFLLLIILSRTVDFTFSYLLFGFLFAILTIIQFWFTKFVTKPDLFYYLKILKLDDLLIYIKDELSK